ncbi:cold shock domain-containing protein, partial [bacterium]|nr:cold shock domain-containing protein [bacterium]
GFGFIIDNESGSEYFVHISGVDGQIKEGDEVQFEVEQGKRGLNAVNVQVI